MSQVQLKNYEIKTLCEEYLVKVGNQLEALGKRAEDLKLLAQKAKELSARYDLYFDSLQLNYQFLILENNRKFAQDLLELADRRLLDGLTLEQYQRLKHEG